MRKLIILAVILLFSSVAIAELTLDPPKTQGGVTIQDQLYPFSSQSMTADTTTSTCATALVGQVIRLYSTVDCFIDFGGVSVTATTGDCFLPSGTVATFAAKGDTYLAVIASSTTGTLYITDMY